MHEIIFIHFTKDHLQVSSILYNMRQLLEDQGNSFQILSHNYALIFRSNMKDLLQLSKTLDICQFSCILSLNHPEIYLDKTYDFHHHQHDNI